MGSNARKEHLKVKELWKKRQVILLSDEALGVDRAVAVEKFSDELRWEGARVTSQYMGPRLTKIQIQYLTAQMLKTNIKFLFQLPFNASTSSK